MILSNITKNIIPYLEKIQKLDEKTVIKQFGIEKDILIEWFKCKISFRYFCYKYAKIPEPGSDIKLKTNEAQEIFINEFFKNPQIVINKSRQIGLSTILQAMSIWLTIFYKNVIVGVISRDRPEATDFVKKAKNILFKLPDWMIPPLETDREQKVAFVIPDKGGTGSSITSGWVNLSNPESIFRGPAITLLIIDEAAFIRKIDLAFKGVMASTSRAQEIAKKKGIPYGTVIISTPNKIDGVGEWFYHQYVAGMSPDSEYKSLFLHWSLIKEYRENPEWYKNQMKKYIKKDGSIDYEQVDQEYNGVFLSKSEESLFNQKAIRLLNFYNFNYIKLYKNFEGSSGDLEIYEEFNKDELYIISYDTANLSGNSYSTVQVVKFDNLEQVAEYQGKVRIVDFPNIIKSITKLYPNYLLIGEYNTINESVGDTLYRDNEIREHMFREKVFTKKRGRRAKGVYETETILKKINNGIETTGKSKPIMIDNLKLFIDKNPHLIKSQRLKLELAGAKLKNNKMVSSITTDLIMALTFAIYLKYEGLYRDIEYYKKWKYRNIHIEETKEKNKKAFEIFYEDDININNLNGVQNLNLININDNIINNINRYSNLFHMR